MLSGPVRLKAHSYKGKQQIRQRRSASALDIHTFGARGTRGADSCHSHELFGLGAVERGTRPRGARSLILQHCLACDRRCDILSRFCFISSMADCWKRLPGLFPRFVQLLPSAHNRLQLRNLTHTTIGSRKVRLPSAPLYVIYVREDPL